jgi:hypothetical protein
MADEDAASSSALTVFNGDAVEEAGLGAVEKPKQPLKSPHLAAARIQALCRRLRARKRCIARVSIIYNTYLQLHVQ